MNDFRKPSLNSRMVLRLYLYFIQWEERITEYGYECEQKITNNGSGDERDKLKRAMRICETLNRVQDNHMPRRYNNITHFFHKSQKHFASTVK